MDNALSINDVSVKVGGKNGREILKTCILSLKVAKFVPFWAQMVVAKARFCAPFWGFCPIMEVFKSLGTNAEPFRH